MPTLEAIATKIKRLQEQADAIKAKQASATLDRIVELMQESGVTVADIEAHIGGKKAGARRGKATPVPAGLSTAKYQDPKTGATWSGRGRAPAWIAQVKNRARFLVDGTASDSSTSASTKAKRRGNYITGPQPAKYRDPKSGATWSGRGPAPAWMGNAKNRTRFLIEDAQKVGDSKDS
ncbi:H-NS histone family protein [Trinickia acidisoli]|uniref:H-NS histone family protein n=1 Tax=Trinickia acidisoli TaxID=2767482 RepID=UPI001A8E30C6|nr:H-NS family nucleoid-associated regulatory protein [Trinickia acidisoli]